MEEADTSEKKLQTNQPKEREPGKEKRRRRREICTHLQKIFYSQYNQGFTYQPTLYLPGSLTYLSMYPVIPEDETQQAVFEIS